MSRYLVGRAADKIQAQLASAVPRPYLGPNPQQIGKREGAVWRVGVRVKDSHALQANDDGAHGCIHADLNPRIGVLGCLRSPAIPPWPACLESYS